MVRSHMIEIRQNESIGEEDCVIKERLRDHQRKSQQGSHSESDEKRLKDLPQRRVRARPHEHWLERRSVFKDRAAQAEFGFDFIDYFFGFRLPSMNDEPARAFRDPRPQKKNGEAERGTDEKCKPPADVGIEGGGVQKDDGSSRSQRAADPK